MTGAGRRRGTARQRILKATALPTRPGRNPIPAPAESIPGDPAGERAPPSRGQDPVEPSGHSQGAMLLADLLHFEIDPKPDVRGTLVSALLLGGNVTVAAGRTTGGDFANIPACGSTSQTGCVVGYSSFAEVPPPDAVFGRVTGALGMLPVPRTGTQQILCVNPAAPGGTGPLLPYFSAADVVKLAGGPEAAPTTAFVSYPNALTAQCQTSGDASWLQVTPVAPARGTPRLSGSEGPAWGLHDLDVSLGLGNLVELVRSEAAAFRS